MLSPSAPTILFKHLFFNNQKYGGVIQLFSPHIRPILPIIRSFAMTLLHQIFRQAQSSICLNSPVLLNSTLFPDRFTVLHINATFLKVGIVCGTAVLVCALHRRLFPTVSLILAVHRPLKRSEFEAAHCRKKIHRPKAVDFLYIRFFLNRKILNLHYQIASADNAC